MHDLEFFDYVYTVYSLVFWLVLAAGYYIILTGGLR